MLLAGGQGSRLGVLTSRIAKPAVPYGGKYRIIDFPLPTAPPNIDTVGIPHPVQAGLNDMALQALGPDRIFGGFIYCLRFRARRAGTGTRVPPTQFTRI